MSFIAILLNNVFVNQTMLESEEFAQTAHQDITMIAIQIVAFASLDSNRSVDFVNLSALEIKPM
jgi:hypothetical protein